MNMRSTDGGATFSGIGTTTKHTTKHIKDLIVDNRYPGKGYTLCVRCGWMQ